jgi:hypothetical protein
MCVSQATPRLLPEAKIAKGNNEMVTVEEVIQFIEDDVGSFHPYYIHNVIKGHNLEVGEPLEVFIQRVREERTRWAVEATKRFFESLGVPLDFIARAATKALEKNGKVVADWSPRQGLKIDITGEKPFRFPTPLDLTEEKLGFSIWPDVVDFAASSGLRTLNRKAFFRSSSPEGTEKALNTAKALRPFFSAIGLEDLESALQALASLQEGEARMEGPYVIARMGGVFALRRGLMLGDPYADGSLLTKGEAHVAFPRGVELDLKIQIGTNYYFAVPVVRITYFRIRVGGEEVAFGDWGSERNIFFRNPISSVLKAGLEKELRFRRGEVPPAVWEEFPPRVAAVLIALVRHEDPLIALSTGEFHPYATAELFANL